MNVKKTVVYLILIFGFGLLGAQTAKPSSEPEQNKDGGTIYEVGDLLQKALESSVQIQELNYQVLAAKARQKGAEAAFYPNLGMDLKLILSANPSEGLVLEAGALGSLPLSTPAGTTTILLPSETLTVVQPSEVLTMALGLSLDQPLVTWGKLEGTLDLRKTEYQLNLLALDRAKEKLSLEVFKALYALDSLQTAYSILLTQERSAQEGFLLVQASRKAGTLTDIDLSLARLDLEALVRNKEKLEAQEADLLAQLSLLSGIKNLQAKDIRLDRLNKSFSQEKLLEKDLESNYLVNNTDLRLKAAQAQMNSQVVKLAQAQARPLPDLGLSVRGGISLNGSPGLTENWTWDDNGDWYLNLIFNASGTLVDFGKKAAVLEEKKADLARSRLDYSQSVEETRSSQASLSRNLKRLAADLAYQEERVTVYKTRLDQMELKKKTGAISDVDLLKARSDYLNEVLARSSAYKDYALEYLDLAYIMEGSLMQAGTF